jgi:hypothetical protein
MERPWQDRAADLFNGLNLREGVMEQDGHYYVCGECYHKVRKYIIGMHTSTGESPPWCKACREPACEVEGSEHGGDDHCAMVRVYLRAKEECKDDCLHYDRGVCIVGDHCTRRAYDHYKPREDTCGQ